MTSHILLEQLCWKTCCCPHSSCRYGAHLSREQVAELVAPHPDTLELVNSWLEHHSVPSSSISTSHGSGWLTLTGVSVSQANALLEASYELYNHTETKDQVLRTLGYALPTVLHAHVQSVSPTTHFSSPRTPRLTPRERSGEAAHAPGRSSLGELRETLSSRFGLVTPPFLCWIYNFSTYVPAAADQNALGVVGYLGDYPSHLDMTTFMSSFRIDAEDPTFDFVQIGGGNPQDNPHMEANLDIQYAEAITYPTHIIYYSNAGSDVYMWLKYMLSWHSIPPMISISYGEDEKKHSRRLCKGVVHPVFATQLAWLQCYCLER